MPVSVWWCIDVLKGVLYDFTERTRVFLIPSLSIDRQGHLPGKGRYAEEAKRLWAQASSTVYAILFGVIDGFGDYFLVNI